MSDDHGYGALERSLRAALGAPTATTGDPARPAPDDASDVPGGAPASSDAPAPSGSGVPSGAPAPSEGPTARAAGAEADALAAFRAARDAGLHASRETRRRDDWTPATDRRRPRRPLKTAVAALFASATLGGVAVAGGGLGDLPGTHTPSPEPRPAGVLPAPTRVPGKAGSTSPGPPETSTPIYPEGHHAPPPDAHREALCHAFEKGGKQGRGQGTGKGKGGDAVPPPAAWRRLVDAAGGEDRVPAFCGRDQRPGQAPPAGARPKDGTGRDASSSDSGDPPNGRAATGPDGPAARPSPPASRNE
ncbi:MULTISPECIES: hypothetical protein [Streptomyces]|uniref:hypothetical protein n=1 Tax=Streptomyces TaxID=1883 RepID=UPI00068CEA26|nr:MULTISPECIES: hypothetical protein [Streptomyces]